MSSARLAWDRYWAPEVLTAVFGGGGDDVVVGEGFGSDIYSLGLVLFETLVRPLALSDLGQFVRAQAYSRDAHFRWLLGLHEEARSAWRAGQLNQDELTLIVQLLEPDVRRRPGDLTTAVEMASMLALRGVSMQEEFKRRPLAAIATLDREDDKRILRFLEEAVDVEPVRRNEKPLKAFVEELLLGAKVYPDLTAKERQLLLVGQRVTFVARPLDWNGTIWDQLAYIEVAKKAHAPKTPPIAVLGAVQLHNVDSLLSIPALLPHGGWQDLFNTMQDRPDVLGPVQRDYLRKLALSVEVERRMWESQCLPFDLVTTEVRQGPRGEEEVATLSARGDAKDSLARTLVAQLERETAFVDLQTTADPVAPFREQTRWQIEGFTKHGDVHIRRNRQVDSSPPPAAGYIRPGGLAGARALYQRRQELLRELEEDPFLLTAVTEPHPVDLPETLDTPFNQSLDDNKKAMVEAILGRRPLFVVQGPPGTGKTTLAAEVILQTLKANPSARILITSQAHEPLNNLLKRVDDELKARGEKHGTRPMSVRLLSEDRLDVARFGEAATQVGRDFHPSAKAAQVLSDAKSWRPDQHGVVDQGVIQKWSSLLKHAEDSGLSAVLESRIVGSASLVYATANDRRLASIREDAFDLVIYEEAARAYPIEVLGPMRLARRWLLIGDHQQLLPFGVNDYKDVLDEWFDQREASDLVDDRSSKDAIDLEEWLKGRRLADLKQEMLTDLSLFQQLHERGQRTRPPLSGRLTQQWRMAPEIGRMLSHVFYPHLENAPEELLRGRAHRLTEPRDIRGIPLVWLDTKPVTIQEEAGETHSAGGGFQNSFEGRALLGFLGTLSGRRLSTSIIAPYRAQAKAIRGMVQTWADHNRVTGPLAQSVSTVDSFQGRQSGIVGVSLVRNNTAVDPQRAIGFLNDVARATVMFSRAESLLVVVGCSAHFLRFPNSIIADMYRYFEKHGAVLSAGEFVKDETLARLRSMRQKLNQPWVTPE